MKTTPQLPQPQTQNNDDSKKRKREEIDEKFDIETEFQCTICLDTLVEPVSLICGHNFCKECLNSHPLEKCPNCRTPICCGANLEQVNKPLEKAIMTLVGNKTYRKRVFSTKKKRKREFDAELYFKSDRYICMRTLVEDMLEKQPFYQKIGDVVEKLKETGFETVEVDYFLMKEIVELESIILVKDMLIDVSYVDDFFDEYREELEPALLLYLMTKYCYDIEDFLETAVHKYEKFQNNEYKYLYEKDVILKALSKSDRVR